MIEAKHSDLSMFLNTRGLPLSSTDVLKSMNLEFVPKERRDGYFKKWRDVCFFVLT